ncbi:MAG: hypothetical protein ACOCZK_02315 [Planctomycetota bacterium]
MNPPPAPHDSERQIVAIIQDHLARLGNQHVARTLGVDRSTISRRLSSHRLAAWSLADFVALCRTDHDADGWQLFDTVGRALFPQRTRPADRLEHQALVALARLGSFTERACALLAEDHLGEQGLAQMDEELDRLTTALEHLRADMERASRARHSAG